ncbi:single-stranded DNA-binding protein [Kocuria sp.]|uniref:single-stranded DNA-binding protein n=1 Tax=Kocuria sp. TaxID=1871328 RepID=UPI0026DF196F|nr:single-stranded DNA-binding protein [Kocuria sp.]MDO5619290.1 single-stranded DNA-binding protein [Kocuria sp.]
MAGETIVTIIGNLTSDAELRFTPSGAAVANFTIASTPRQYDRQTQQYVDGNTLFIRCTIWREAAENVAESLTKGTRVIAHGRLESRSFDTKEGERRTVFELQVDEVGPSLRFATAKVTRNARGQGQQGGQSYQGGHSDPWGQTGASAGAQAQSWDQPQGGSSVGADEPAF